MESWKNVRFMKDPYVFDFIPFREDMLERDIEQALIRDVTKLLLELGIGFAFWGNQYHLNVGGILKKEQDNPSIGLLLCKSKNNVVAEYSLKDLSISRSSISYVGKKCNNSSLNAIDIFADGMVYYIIN